MGQDTQLLPYSKKPGRQVPQSVSLLEQGTHVWRFRVPQSRHGWQRKGEPPMQCVTKHSTNQSGLQPQRVSASAEQFFRATWEACSSQAWQRVQLVSWWFSLARKVPWGHGRQVMLSQGFVQGAVR